MLETSFQDHASGPINFAFKFERLQENNKDMTHEIEKIISAPTRETKTIQCAERSINEKDLVSAINLQ